jgi:hypothetical protein
MAKVRGVRTSNIIPTSYAASVRSRATLRAFAQILLVTSKEATYPRSEEKEDKSGNNAATGGKGKGKGAKQGKAGSVSAVAPNSAEQNSDDWESWNEYQDYRRFCARRRGKP